MRQVFENAKRGSFKDLVVLANHPELVPSKYTCDVLAIFCSQFEGNPFSAMCKNPQNSIALVISGATIMQGIVNLYSKTDDWPTQTSGPILVKSWSKFQSWIDFLDVASKLGEYPDAGLGDIENNFQGLFQIALNCRDAKSKAYFEERIPSAMAKRWSTEKTPGDDGFQNTKMMGPCIRTADDGPLFLKNFIQSTGMSDENFVDEVLRQGKILLQQTMKNFHHIQSHLYTLRAFKFTHMWEVLLARGGLNFVLQVFATLANATRASVGSCSSLESCFRFFREVLMTKSGYPFLLRMIKGDFLESFINCGRRFGDLNEAEIVACKDVLAEIPGYFYILPVLECVASALEKIGSDGRRRIQGSCLEGDWVIFETRLLELIIRKNFFDYSKQGRLQAFCLTVSLWFLPSLSSFDHSDKRYFKCKKNNINGTFSKCAGCRRTFYCSKECQKVDWSKGGHRVDCKRWAIVEDGGMSLMLNFVTPGQKTDNPYRLAYLADRVIQKSVRFAAMITSDQKSRYYPGLRSQLDAKMPGHSMGQARLVAHPMSWPVVLDLGLALDVLEDENYVGLKGLEGNIKKGMEAPDDKSIWVKMSLPYGEKETVDLVNLRSPLDGSGALKKLPGQNNPICRPPAVDSGGVKLEAQWDKVDEVLRILKFQRPDEWYASGPGSLDRLNEKVQSIIVERQIVFDVE